jgi:probable blue pigment (indigoidine) exporter
MVFGTTYIVTSLTLPADSPLWMSIWRMLPASIFLLAIGLLFFSHSKGHNFIPPRAWWPRLLLQGILNTCMYVGVFLGAYELPGGLAGTLAATAPLQSILFTWILDKTAPRAAQVFAGCLGLAAISILVLEDVHASALGLVAALAVGPAIFFLSWFSKRWGKSPMAMPVYTGWALLIGAGITTPIVWAISGSSPSFDFHGILGIGWISLIGTALAMVNWYKGVAVLPIVTVSFLGLLSPIVAIALGAVIAQESFTLLQWGAIFCVLLSVVIAIWPTKATKSKMPHSTESIKAS